MIVVGGGAAGFMAAITASERGNLSVLLIEANSQTLEKVRISGGGRCNVTNACWDPKDLVLNYPRGSSWILNSFRRFASGDAVAWFAERGVNLITEKDGRMFPSSNSSSEIISCLRHTAQSSGVNIRTNLKVKIVKKLSTNEFSITCSDESSFNSRSVLLATGSNPSGRKIATDLGHTIVKPVPSLYSFQARSNDITTCSGLALNNVDLKLITTNKTFYERGRILITHWGFSGPSILRLSAFAARELYFDNYKFNLIINWINCDFATVNSIFDNCRANNGNKTLHSCNPFSDIPKRLWLIFLKRVGIDQSIKWAELKLTKKKQLINILFLDNYSIKGRGPFKDEFVTAGGIPLEEVNLSNMESLKTSDLFFAGELMDVDGITGGFNFQHCWTSGWIAGSFISKKYSRSK